MRFFDQVLARIAPYDCLVCGDEGALICVDCIPALGTPIPSRCFRCQKLTENFRVCESCRPAVGLSRVYSKYVYKGFAKVVIKEFKFGGKRAAAKELARLMVDCVPKHENLVLVHIPTATDRIRERGYDHAQLLAAELSKLTGLPHLPLLARTSQQRQLGLGRSERLKNVHGAFRVAGDVKNAHILLVDDVVTTGATLSEAARILKIGEARHIEAITFAVTVL